MLCVLSCFVYIWLCDHMNCSLPGSSVHRILQANTGVGCHAQWVAFFRGSSWPRDQMCISCGSYICYGPRTFLTSLVAQTVKCLPTMQETQVRSLDQEDPLEKEMATHSSTLVWKIPWTEVPGRLQSTGSQSRTQLSDFTSLHLLDIVGCTCFHPPLPLWAIKSKTQYIFHYCIFSTSSRDNHRRGT